MKISTLLKGALPLFAFALMGQGCFDLTGSQPTALDGGVFRTADQAVTWKQLNPLSLGPKLGSIADVGTVSAAFDPQDPKAVYVGTAVNGLIYSLDGGESWMSAKGLNAGRVNMISVDPQNKCVVYVAKDNQIIKTDNCGRDWKQVFYDERTDKQFTAVAVDWHNPNVVYAATSEGDLLRSDNAGAAWGVLMRIEGTRINDLQIDTRDSRNFYLATQGAGIYKMANGGTSSTQIVQPFDQYDGARRPIQIVLDRNSPNTLYQVSRYGILKSDDAGASWRALTLPNPPNTVVIKSLAVNPTNARQLVYATDTSIVFTSDGGATWTSKKLPTTRGVSFVAFDRSTPPNLFLGAAPAKK
jgi:photosystem II stability/assembly factor-like uncharacterized protein